MKKIFERTNSNHVHYRNHRNRHKHRHKVKPKLALVLSVILHTWLPRSYSKNTLLTAGCCKSELSYLKHWYHVLCPGLVKPILGHSWRRSWYMRLFHTSRTSFLLFRRLWKHNSCSGFIFIPGKNLKALSRAFAHKSSTWNQNIYEKFQWLLLAITLIVFTCGRWRHGVLCVIQSLPHPHFGCVTRFAEWFCVRPSFLFSPSPLPCLNSPLP